MELKPQDEKFVTYARELKKEDGKIDWNKPAIEIERMVRAYFPWPSAFGQLRIKNEELRIVKILEAENNIIAVNKFKIGEIFLSDNKLAVQTGDGALIIKKLQLEGGKPLNAEEFLRGHPDFVGTVLS